jgi:hypothetical protein
MLDYLASILICLELMHFVWEQVYDNTAEDCSHLHDRSQLVRNYRP